MSDIKAKRYKYITTPFKLERKKGQQPLSHSTVQNAWFFSSPILKHTY